MADLRKYTTEEILSLVLNTGEDALKVDIDNVTLTTEGADVHMEVNLDQSNDSVVIYSNTVKDETGTSLIPIVDTDGHLQVDVLSSVGVTMVDDAAFTPATDNITMVGATFDDAAPDSVDEGDGGAIRMSGNRNLYTQLRDAAGNERGVNVTAANELNVLDSNSAAIKTAVELIDDAIAGTEMQVDVVAALPAGTNTIGAVSVTAVSGDGADMLFDSSGDNTAQAIKASAGSLYALEVSNSGASDAWIQLFNVATGSVTVGTTVPNQSYFVPAGGAMDKVFATPIAFGTAISYACTTTATGNGNPGTALVVNAVYK